MKKPIHLVLYLLVVVILYIVILRFIEPGAEKLFYQIVTKNLVHDKKQILDMQQKLTLGIYRPELPYHFDKVYEIQDSLGVKLKVISFYKAWGDEDSQQLELEVLRNISRGGFVPLITWEPWIVAFDEFKGKNVDSSLTHIIDGKFDYYIRDWARKITRFGKPLFLRLAHEMTNPWYSWSHHHGNTPAMFKAMWKHVFTIFESEGAQNAAFVWSPYTPKDSLYYPGSEYVDWIALDIFNYGSLSESGLWMDFTPLTKLYYDQYKTFEKPIMIAEVGCSSYGGNKNQWYKNMFHSFAVNNFPLIKLLVLFDNPAGKTPTGFDVDWSMSADSVVYEIIKSHVDMKKITMGAQNHD